MDDETKDWAVTALVLLIAIPLLLWGVGDAVRFRNILLGNFAIGAIHTVARIGKPREPITHGDAVALIVVTALHIYGLMRYVR